MENLRKQLTRHPRKIHTFYSFVFRILFNFYESKFLTSMYIIFSEGSTESSAAVLNIQKLQQEISDLKSALTNVELSQEALQLQMKNCCKNDSFYAMTIQTHVNRILQQVSHYSNFVKLK